MTPDTDSEEGSKRRANRDLETGDDDDPSIEAPSVVDRDDEDRPDDEPR